MNVLLGRRVAGRADLHGDRRLGLSGEWGEGNQGGCDRWGCGGSQPYQQPYNQNPYNRQPRYVGGYGYDYTGYYYFNTFPEYRRYSYTCGYYYNCY